MLCRFQETPVNGRDSRSACLSLAIQSLHQSVPDGVSCVSTDLCCLGNGARALSTLLGDRASQDGLLGANGGRLALHVTQRHADCGSALSQHAPSRRDDGILNTRALSFHRLKRYG